LSSENWLIHVGSPALGTSGKGNRKQATKKAANFAAFYMLNS